MQSRQADVVAKIKDNLTKLNFSQNNSEKIISVVQGLPGKDHALGALSFLTEVVDSKSKREDYYVHSDYLAEYFCTLSNLGLFAVGFYYQDFATLTAATFSALSHAIPSQRLHDLDMLGVLCIFGKVAANYKTMMARPEVLAWGAGAMAVNVLDTIITRQHLDKVGPSIHSMWHLAAAFAMYKMNEATLDVTQDELQAVSAAALTQTVPDFLSVGYQAVVEQVDKCFAKSIPLGL